jgi:hypothetical protein
MKKSCFWGCLGCCVLPLMLCICGVLATITFLSLKIFHHSPHYYFHHKDIMLSMCQSLITFFVIGVLIGLFLLVFWLEKKYPNKPVSRLGAGVVFISTAIFGSLSWLLWSQAIATMMVVGGLILGIIVFMYLDKDLATKPETFVEGALAITLGTVALLQFDEIFGKDRTIMTVFILYATFLIITTLFMFWRPKPTLQEEAKLTNEQVKMLEILSKIIEEKKATEEQGQKENNKPSSTEKETSTETPEIPTQESQPENSQKP